MVLECFFSASNSFFCFCLSVCLSFHSFSQNKFIKFFWFFMWSQCSDFEDLVLKWLDFWGTFFIERIVSKKDLIWLCYVLLRLFANFITRLLCNWHKMRKLSWYIIKLGKFSEAKFCGWCKIFWSAIFGEVISYWPSWSLLVQIQH